MPRIRRTKSVNDLVSQRQRIMRLNSSNPNREQRRSRSNRVNATYQRYYNNIARAGYGESIGNVMRRGSDGTYYTERLPNPVYNIRQSNLNTQVSRRVYMGTSTAG